MIMLKENTPKKTVNYPRNQNGRFANGNIGKPKGAINRSTKELKEFIINFLNDKAFEIPLIWNSLEDKDKATLYLHLTKLVLPKVIEDEIAKKKDIPVIVFKDFNKLNQIEEDNEIEINS